MAHQGLFTIAHGLVGGHRCRVLLVPRRLANPSCLPVLVYVGLDEIVGDLTYGPVPARVRHERDPHPQCENDAPCSILVGERRGMLFARSRLNFECG